MGIISQVDRNRWLNVGFPTVQRTALNAILGDPSAFRGTAGAGVQAEESVAGGLRYSTLRFTDLAQAVVNGVEYQGSNIFTFPEGAISVMGCFGSIAQKTTSDIATTLNASVTGAVSLGTATASATTLSGAMADIAPSIAFTSSATINVAGAAVTPFLAAPINLNGTAGAKSIWLNSAYAVTTDVDANATQTWTGTIVVVWAHLGDQ